MVAVVRPAAHLQGGAQVAERGFVIAGVVVEPPEVPVDGAHVRVVGCEGDEEHRARFAVRPHRVVDPAEALLHRGQVVPRDADGWVALAVERPAHLQALAEQRLGSRGVVPREEELGQVVDRGRDHRMRRLEAGASDGQRFTQRRLDSRSARMSAPAAESLADRESARR
jgi:hypothetical protein